MDLLSSIQSKKKTLKHTQTIVTNSNGNRTLCDGNDECQPLPANPSTVYGFIVDTKPDHMAVCILNDFLYLGSQDAVNENNIRDLCLTHILSVGITVSSPSSLKHKFVPCLDLSETNLNDIVPQCNDFINECRGNNGRILVHCNAGVSRSASIVIAYLILLCGFKFDDAWTLVKSKRQCIRPNDGFLRQLRQM